MQILEKQKLSFGIRLNRFLLLTSIIILKIEDAVEAEELKFGLKKRGKLLLKSYTDLIDNTYKNFKKRHGEKKYKEFCENYNSNFDKMYAKFETLELDNIDSLILICTILEDDLHNLIEYDLQDVPMLATYTKLFLKQLKIKNSEFHKIIHDIVYENEYNIRNKSYYNFCEFTSKIKIK